MGELKGYTCSCAETMQDGDTRAFAPFALGFAPFARGSNHPSAPDSTPNSSGISSSILVFANNSHQPSVVADSGVASPSSGRKLFGEAALTTANTCSFVNTPFGQISALGQWGKSTPAKADISTTTATNPFAPSGMTTACPCPLTTMSCTTNPFAPPLQSHLFSFNNSLPSHNTRAEDSIHNHGWKPVFDNNSSNQGIGSQASFQKSTGMTSHSETPSLCGGGIPPPSASTVTGIHHKSLCFCKSPFPESAPSPSGPFSCKSIFSPFWNPTSSFSVPPPFQESRPSLSGSFSFKGSSSLFEKPAFSFGKQRSTFKPVKTHDKWGRLWSIMSISAIPINEDKSHEELRLEYYPSQGKVKEQDDTASKASSNSNVQTIPTAPTFKTNQGAESNSLFDEPAFSSGKAKEQDDISSKATPYPVYPFIPVMMLPSMVMLPLVPNPNAAFNVPSWDTSTGFPAASYPLFNCYGAPSIYGPPISMLAIDPHQSNTSMKS